MPELNRLSREEYLSRTQPLQDLSDEELLQLKKQYQLQSQQNMTNVLGGAAGQAGNVFLGLAGVPAQRVAGTSGLDQRIMAELLKQQYIVDPREKVKQQQEEARFQRGEINKLLNEASKEGIQLEVTPDMGIEDIRNALTEERIKQKSAKMIESGKGKGIEEAFKQGENIKRAFKKLGSITSQFNEFLPTGQKVPVEQRISGLIDSIGAQTGLKPNPGLQALQQTAKLQLRSILRDMGEGARLSDQDIKQNIAVIEQAGLTNTERKALVRSFMQTAIDSMSADVLNVLLEDVSAVKTLSDFGVRLPNIPNIPTKTTATEDFSQMSDEELQAIIRGEK